MTIAMSASAAVGADKPAKLAAATPAAGKQVVLRYEPPGKPEAGLDYLLFLPVGYDATPGKWPLMVFLHGAGECGPDINKVKVHGPPKLVEERPQDFPFIVVSPQSPEIHVSKEDQHYVYFTNWALRPVGGLITEIEEKYRVDSKRIYLTGLSMGGFGTWAWGTRQPERFAALLPICGGGFPHEVKNSLQKLPVWAFHGDKDNVVDVAYGQEMVDVAVKSGGPSKLTVYPGVGHDSWTETYNNPEVYRWLLSHRKQ